MTSRISPAELLRVIYAGDFTISFSKPLGPLIVSPNLGNNVIIPPSMCTMNKQDEFALDPLVSLVEGDAKFIVAIIQAGAAIVAVCDIKEIWDSKTIRRYMVRKTQGKSQIKHLKTKGKSRLGSRIRLNQSEKFFDDINTHLQKLLNIDQLHGLYLSCSPTLLGLWRQSRNYPLTHSQLTIFKIPYHSHLPNAKELVRIHLLLTEIKITANV